MRRLSTFAFLAVVIQLVLPARALAWWDFIEELSGPGRFYGWDVEVRLFCLTESQTQKREDGEPVTQKFGPTLGSIVTACTVKRGQTRRLAVDLGARFLWADNNPQFANGERISLTTLEPSVSINLLSRYPGKDFIDYGFGAGTYWFSSTQFPAFHGTFIEPIRLEFHTTTKFKQDHDKWTALIPVVRVGYLVFPAGFETASFAAAAGVPPRISRDWVFNGGVFFDLEGLFK